MAEITRIPAPAYPEVLAPEELSETQKESCLLISNRLIEAFDWSLSAEGHEFWKQVQRRLRGLSEGEPLK